MSQNKLNTKIEAFREQVETPPTTAVFAFEGVNGSGKSHALSMVREQLEKQGVRVISNKISGLGNSDEVESLKNILKYREEERLSGKQTTKHIKDHRRQILFRLATRMQIRQYFESLSENEPDVVLLDRTPLMTYAYALSDDPTNPYINEIRAEAFELTRRLGITRIFLFDIDHLTSITRTLARTAISQPNPYESIMSACEIMNIPDQMRNELVKKIFKFIDENPDLAKKDLSAWDLNPYSIVLKESIIYKRVLGEASNELGIQFSVIDSTEGLVSIRKNLLDLMNLSTEQ